MFLFCSLNLARSQTVSWDSTYRPDIHKPQVELFKSMPHSRKDIIFLGNSLTFWADWSELLGSSRYKNRGIPGDITFGVLERLDDVIKGRPNKVFILIGINDLARNIPDSIILSNYQKIINKAKYGYPCHQNLFPDNASYQ